MSSTTLSRLWTTGIKKGLDDLVMQLGLCIFKVRLRITEASARRADMSLQCGSAVQWRPSWQFLGMTIVVIWHDRTAPRRWPYSVQQSDETEQLHAADVVQDIISYFWPLGPYMLYSVSTTSGPPVKPRFHCNYPPLSYKRTVQAVHLRGVNSTQTLCDVSPLSKDGQY
jgi:hypothetical protein